MVEMRNSLKFKVGSYLVVVLTIAVFIFAMMLVRNNREELMQQVTKNSGQLSRVVISSTRFAMLQNQPSHVNQIIQDVGDQEDIEKVRILSKEGVIIHSSEQARLATRWTRKPKPASHATWTRNPGLRARCSEDHDFSTIRMASECWVARP